MNQYYALRALTRLPDHLANGGAQRPTCGGDHRGAGPEWLVALWRTVMPHFNRAMPTKPRREGKIEAGGKTVEYAFNFARNPSIDGLRVICSPPGTEFDKQQLAEGFGYSGKNPWKENHERILRLIGSFFEEGSTNRVLRRKDR
jgi:hypothetical protein